MQAFTGLRGDEKKDQNVATASGRKGQLPRVKRLQSSDLVLLEKNQKCCCWVFFLFFLSQTW